MTMTLAEFQALPRQLRVRIVQTGNPARVLKMWTEAAAALDIDPTPDAAAHMARAVSLHNAARAAVDTSSERQRIVDDLAAGHISETDAAQALAALTIRTGKDGTRLLTDAADRARALAARALRERGDALVADLAPTVGEILERVAALKLPDGIDSTEAAVAAGPKAAAAWAEYADLESRWHTIHDNVDNLRCAGILPATFDKREDVQRPGIDQTTISVSRGYVISDAHRYGNPAAARNSATPLLVVAIHDGWEPGIYTADEARNTINTHVNDARAHAANNTDHTGTW